MNSCNFTGRLTADPELKTTNGGVSVCSFTLAVKRPHVKDTTDFIYFVTWRQSAEYLCKYGHKGDTVEVEGALTCREWDDKDGNKRKSFEVSADNVRVYNLAKLSDNAALDAFTSNAQQMGVPVNAAPDGFEVIVGGDDLPF